jgi:hypothetical protein
MGDLNTDLNNLRDDRATQVPTIASGLGLEHLLSLFRRGVNIREVLRGTCHKTTTRLLRWCDYILGSDWDIFTKVTIEDPHHFSSYNYMVKGTILSIPRKENKSYSRWRSNFMFRLSRAVPQTKSDSIFDE